jgi:hypothetical protein
MAQVRWLVVHGLQMHACLLCRLSLQGVPQCICTGGHGWFVGRPATGLIRGFTEGSGQPLAAGCCRCRSCVDRRVCGCSACRIARSLCAFLLAYRFVCASQPHAGQLGVEWMWHRWLLACLLAVLSTGLVLVAGGECGSTLLSAFEACQELGQD